MDSLIQRAREGLQHAIDQLVSPDFYAQVAIVAVSLIVAWAISALLIRRIRIFREEPQSGRLLDLRLTIHRMHELVTPLMIAIVMGISTQISGDAVGQVWLVRAAQAVAFIFLVFSLASHFINSATIIFILKWFGLPLAVLYAFGWLDTMIAYMETIAFEVGNVRITLYAVLRTFVFGVVLFWLGRVSNNTGQRVIRNQPALDAGTREVVAKLFEIALFAIIFLLLLNIMGIDLTALAVFGGALGVGLGFGLQQIASNFISGIIILLDRTITIGDYIELEDGRSGTLRELTMRSATLETYDGKDIMVPNEKFITTAFTNWTHYNKKQRYSLHFSVAYKTDLEKLFEIVREVVASHPKVLSGDDLPIAERPDAEIENFGDSGINILVEFWMEGIDDGDNRVGADLLLMIWTALREHGIEIPFPQREVRVLGDVKTADSPRQG